MPHYVDTESLEEGTKFDTGKNRLELIPPEAIEALGQVLTFGAEKYDDRNWEKGINYSRVYGAALRHMNAWFDPRYSSLDNETKLSHLAHALCCISFLLTYEARGMEEFDDRPTL